MPKTATVRVSLSALLRVRHEDHCVLFHSVHRPGSYGPPGGAIKYFPPAAGILDELRFERERVAWRSGDDNLDLRGFLPAGNLRALMRWFRSGAYRESAHECLVRELREELHEVGLGKLDGGLDRLGFRLVREVEEKVHDVPGQDFRQYRHFGVYDLLVATTTARRLVQGLIDAGRDDEVPYVLMAGAEHVNRGRQGAALIAPHSVLLLRAQRILPDIPVAR